MKLGFARKSVVIAGILLFFSCCASSVYAQTDQGILRGQVTDPSGSAVGNATVLVSNSAASTPATTKADGTYEVKGLAPGKYDVKVIAEGFSQFDRTDIQILAGQIQKLDVKLTIETQQQKVVVTDRAAAALDVNPENNAGAIVMQGKDLEQLSDDPDELQSDLQALAGPSAGPNGGQIYIDGFTGGQLPPKASIREIRINLNPFSAEYDKLGYGRIEILTKPGTDQWHGQVSFNGNDSAFNSKSPFVEEQPGYESNQFGANIGGPVNKNASFFFNIERRSINESTPIDATILDANLQPSIFNLAVPNPRNRLNLSPRLDYQLGKNNTLTIRYQYYRNTMDNNGLGQFSLPSTAYNSTSSEQTLQISDTQTLGTKTINETRFQYLRDRDTQQAQSNAPTIDVPGAFISGGNSQGSIIDNQDHYELQNYTTTVLGNHTLKYGARFRVLRDANNSTSNFNGSFTFQSFNSFQLTEQLLAQGVAPADLQSMGAGPVQYAVTVPLGAPNPNVAVFDAGIYAQDDWKVRPNLTFSYGGRFETQNYIGDKADFAPRLGLAWGLGGKNKPPKTVLRAGFGMFYDRFTSDLLLDAERLNGLIQQEFIVTNPTFFPNAPPPCIGSQATGCFTANTGALSTYRVDPNLHAPYTMQTGLTVERQLTSIANLSVTYLNSIGVHQLLVTNINAPNPANGGAQEFGAAAGNIFQNESVGTFRQNEIIMSSNVRMGAKLTLFGYYVFNHADSSTAGPSSFASNPFDIRQDYGRASFDTRHRVFVGGSWSLPYAFRISPFLVAQSGPPFDITAPTDLNHTGVLNQRPSFATNPADNPADLFTTPFGILNADPTPGERVIPVNLGTTPARFSLNLRVSKTFGFGRKAEAAPGGGGPGGPGTFGGAGGRGGGRGGPRGGGGGGFGGGAATNHRYNLTLSVNARNVFNVVNTGTPNGVLGSPFFDRPNVLANGPYSSVGANRKIELSASFSF